jgi:hypothetical protein
VKLPDNQERKMIFIRVVIGNIVRNGEFAEWMCGKEMPGAAMKEFDELYDTWLALVAEEFGEDHAKNLDDR